MQSLKNLTIRIDPLFWVLAFGLGFYYSGSFGGMLIWAAIVFASVLIHELGHALTAQYFGQAASITLTFFGGVTKRDGASLPKWKEFLIVLNGPIAGFLLALFALQLTSLHFVKQQPVLLNTLSITYIVNFFWTFINLFPVQPLDGGHLLLILFQGMFGHRGIKIAYFLSTLVAALLGFFFFFFRQVFLGAIFFIFAFDSFRNWRSSLIISQSDSNESLKSAIQESELLISSGHIQEAKAKLQDVMQGHRSNGGVLVLRAAELLAKILYSEGDASSAYNILMPYKKILDIEGLQLLHQIAFKSQHNEEALQLGTAIHQEMANPETALINAFSSADLKNEQATIGWLKTAIDEGIPNPQILLQNPRFDFIRSNTEFKNLLNS